MKKTYIAIMLAGSLAVGAFIVHSLGAIVGEFSMQTSTITNGVTTAASSGNTENGLQGVGDEIFQAHGGAVVVFTNCVLLDGGGLQYGDTNHTVVVKVGNTTEGVSSFYGVWNESNTSWWANVTMPTHTGTLYLQTWVYDINTNLYIYPKLEVGIVEALI